jgi:hypothetical protein
MPRPTPPTLEPYTSQLPDVNNAATWAERTPLFWNWVTGDGYINLTSLLSYSEDAIDFLDGALAGSETLVDAVAAIQSQISGRNLIINGSGRINQRQYVSGTNTSGANQFTLDRWFVVTSGQNLAFTGNDSRRVMTAPAGGVRQVVEGSNIVGGDYVLNWDGTASATVNGTARTKGEVFTLTANTNVVVAFSGGTFTDVQLERGTVATPFELRSIGQELALCQRYYCLTRGTVRSNATAASQQFETQVFWPVEMVSTPSASNLTDGVTANLASVGLFNPSVYGVRLNAISAASGDTFVANRTIIASAELTS